MDYINGLFSSKVFLATLFSWCTAQVMKSVIEIVKNRPRSALKILTYMFWTTGGMPSSHSAVVAALATSVAITAGIQDPLFAVSLFYALLIIRDAMGVRRAAGHQAWTLNKVIAVLKTKTNIRIKPVKEIHGHSPAEVSVGICIGFFIALAFCLL